MKGIIVAPRVIDSDYGGEIKIMTSSPGTISVLQPGQRLAQLLLLPIIDTYNRSKIKHRGNAGFRSSEAY
jgi:dUTPase